MSVGMISDKSASSRGLPRQASEYVWKRNSLWAALPTVTESDQKFVGLYAVYPDAAFIALHATTSSGTYTVDWGDGTNEAVSSGTVAYHTYDYTDADLLSTSLPYKQAIVTVTPTTANLLTVDINRKHSTSGLQAYDAGWLDITISLPNASAGKPFVVSAYSQNVGVRELEVCTIKTLGAHTNMSYMFNNCSSLQSVPAFNTAAVTNMSNMFSSCSSLSNIDMSPIKTTLSLTNCKLSGDRLNEIYGNLGTGLTGKVITVTGNYGVSADDPTLVPSGWTVTG